MQLKEYGLLEKHLQTCDIFVLIHSDREGSKSRNPASIKLECLIADKLGIPILTIVHPSSKIRTIPNLEKTDPKEAALMKTLERFLKAISYDYFVRESYSLGTVSEAIELSIRTLLKTDPPPGWCRVASAKTIDEENLGLKQELERVYALLKDLQESQLAEPKVLSDGNQICGFRLTPDPKAMKEKAADGTVILENPDSPERFSTTWNEVFMHIAPSMMREASEADLKKVLMTL